jgi:arginyl-tRNA--protein-N-Asp/Glu arginylyltransferase
MVEDKAKKKSRYERYNRAHPPITLRVPKGTYDMLKRMADKRGQALGPFCADILLARHCQNCRKALRRKQPLKQIIDLQDNLKAAIKENKTLNEVLKEWQKYAKNMEQKWKMKNELADKYIITLKKEMVPKIDHIKLKCKLNESKKSSDEWIKAYNEIDRENSELWKKYHNLKDINTTLQKELNQRRTQYDKVVNLEDNTHVKQ